jgi:membrane AbrB-like protein
MVGSLLAIILVRCLTPWQLTEIPGGRKCGQWIVGIGIGLHFTPVVMEQVLSHFGLIFFGALVTSLSAVVGVWLMRRTGEDRATAFFSSMPGGSGEMVNLGARNGAKLSHVAAGQSLRVLVVVLCVPAAFKYLLGDGTPISHANSVDWRWLAILFPAGALARLALATPAPTQPVAVRATLGQRYGEHQLGSAHRFAQWRQSDRAVADRQRVGLSLQPAFFRRAPSFMGRTLIGTALTMLIATLGGIGVECIDPTGSAFADAGHDARWDCGDEPDGGDPATVGAVSDGDAGDAAVVCAVSGGAVVQVLES